MRKLNADNLRRLVESLDGVDFSSKKYYPFIKYIKFFNYKKIASGEEINFQYPVTALVGRNGSNKSSIIHALLGAPSGESPGRFWFSTKLDPINVPAEDRPRFFYRYEIPEIEKTAEVRKMIFPNRKLSRGSKRKSDPDYWEPTQPALRDGMQAFPGHVKGYSSQDRWNAAKKSAIIFDLRTDLTAFDRVYSQSLGTNRVDAKKKIRRNSSGLREVIIRSLRSMLKYGKEKVITHEIFSEKNLIELNYILSKQYDSVAYVEHSFFGEGGYSFFFKGGAGQYSDAFAGRGEASVARMIRNISRMPTGSLILLDEPETSLHIEAQSRLLEYLLKCSLHHGHQVVFATHSLAMLEGLPSKAIKCLSIEADGLVRIQDQSSPREAVYYLGGRIANSEKSRIYVEDELAKYWVEKVAEREGKSFSSQIQIEVIGGGADSAIRRVVVPFFAAGQKNVTFLFDGDKKSEKYDSIYKQFPSQRNIPESENDKIEDIVKSVCGQKIPHFASGSGGTSDSAEKIKFYRGFFDYFRRHVRFLPAQSPESYIERLAIPDAGASNAGGSKVLFSTIY